MGERDRKEKKKAGRGEDVAFRPKYIGETAINAADAYLRDIGFAAMDIREDDEAINVEVELAGVNPKDISVTVDNDILTIEGVKKEPAMQGKAAAFHCVERTFGSFKRTFTLGAAVDQRNIEAECKNGILALKLPKVAERRKPSHTIKVRIYE